MFGENCVFIELCMKMVVILWLLYLLLLLFVKFIYWIFILYNSVLLMN